jgi:IMP dehydrogenase
MELISFSQSLSFDDVLLVPNYSTAHPEKLNLKSHLTKNIILNIPLVSSPMDTVTEARLAIALAQEGGIGLIHRNLTIKEQVHQVHQVHQVKKLKESAATNKKGQLLVGAAVGVGTDLEQRLEALVKAKVDVVVLDSAHGHCQYIIKNTIKLRKTYPKLELIGGNVGTGEGALALIKAGVSAIRVGLGPGSICTTRIVSGVGMPQLSAIHDCVRVAKKYKVPIIADGGIRYSGDITKALAAGASTVMMGSLFAQTLEAPGKVVKIRGKKYKYYRGMGSAAAMKKGSASRYGQSVRGVAGKFVSEGVEGLVSYKGTMADLVFQLMGGLKAGMVYIGAHNLKQISQKARFVKMSPAALAESHPHSLVLTDGGENYERK